MRSVKLSRCINLQISGYLICAFAGLLIIIYLLYQAGNRQDLAAASQLNNKPLQPTEVYQTADRLNFAAPSEQTSISFAAIGDFGGDTVDEGYVADMIAGWNPDFVVTVGDNYYKSAGGSDTGKYDEAVGKYYCRFLYGINTTGNNCPNGTAGSNAFFPTLGNHDYSGAGDDTGSNYRAYFDLPGVPGNSSSNERYYDYVQGPVHFFAINSNLQEPDGIKSSSIQGKWLQNQLAASTAPWKIVYFHHAAYSTAATHGDTSVMQWPFDQWGVDVVLQGHDHIYERLEKNGVYYFVTGNGGWNLRSDDCYGSASGAASNFCYDDHYGAIRITASAMQLVLEEEVIDDGANGANGGLLIDSLTLTNDSIPPTPTNTPPPPTSTKTPPPPTLTTTPAPPTSTITPAPPTLTITPPPDAFFKLFHPIILSQ